jgi:hypothetical protein
MLCWSMHRRLEVALRYGAVNEQVIDGDKRLALTSASHAAGFPSRIFCTVAFASSMPIRH